ncbi:aminodeoxychorismate/anthranilate synthase component II [Thalassotalea atypica]|uniref:aminodeoxychorismate/anthranilate synthase component II n=1 Tax=Thalassotalea atypica TaxID=2054316 RepID=UPI002573B6CC|nr:aminodeoxychorismate/anthranilate synthase component II [Thalassotalea atypica]
MTGQTINSSLLNSNKPQIIMLDNFDSFTYNLVDEFYQLGFEPKVYRNTISADYIIEQLKLAGDNAMLVLSPGPGEPTDAGCLMTLIEKAVGQFPILGICLGHQALIQHYGGIIGRAPEIVHGKSSMMTHTAKGAFQAIQNPVPVARYHSLVATKMPEQLITTAQVEFSKESSLVMAVEHPQDAILGFQFHPESILTTYGSHLLKQAICHLLNTHKRNRNTNELKEETL